ncbi:hypothetical protein [Cellulosimicrobium sp. NPDC057127]|uniref:hypothetical protein n=1 Tax=Cellulosimicrobium sp. NPDC057127 TaxID=3346026 RepID=UPI0036257194
MTDTEFRPLTGDPSTLRATADAFARVQAALTTTGDGLAPVRDVLTGQRSTAVTLALGHVDDLVARARTQAALLGAAGDALRDYAERLAERQTAAALAVLGREAALAAQERWDAEERAARVEAAWDPTRVGDPFTADRAVRARAQAEAARDDARRAEDAWRRARDAKQEDAASTTARIVPLHDSAAVRAWVGTGDDLAAFQASAAGLAAARLVDGVVDRSVHGAERDAAVAELARQIDRAGDDPAFWATFYDETPPADLYVLLGEEGSAVGVDGSVLDRTSPAGAVAAAVRSSFGAWTSTLPPEEQEALGARVVDDLGTQTIPVGWSSTATLLLAGAHVHPRVHAGAVRRIEAVRRDLAAHPDPLAPIPFERDTTHLTAAALEGMAASSEESLRYLDGDGDKVLAAARSALWFGTQPAGGWADGGDGVTALLRSAVLLGEAEPDHQRAAALVLSRATIDLPGGLLAHDGLLAARGLLPPDLSETAQRRLADAYAPYIDAFDRNVNAMDDFPAVGTWTALPDAHDAAFPGIAGRHLPYLEPQGLSDVLSATMAGEAGTARWQREMLEHHERTAAAVLAPGSDVRGRAETVSVVDAFLHAHGHAVSDAGVIAGSMHRAALEHAEDGNARYAAQVSTLMTALGLLVPTQGAAAAAAPVLTVTGDYLVSLDGRVQMAVDEAAADGHAEQVVLASRGQSLLLAALAEDGVDPTEAERLVTARLALDDGASRAAFTSAFKEAAGLADPTGTPDPDPTDQAGTP